MFNDTNSFYLSPTGDLTNTLQRQYEQDPQLAKAPLWRRVDDRFFWNREMLRDLTEREVGGTRGIRKRANVWTGGATSAQLDIQC